MNLQTTQRCFKVRARSGIFSLAYPNLPVNIECHFFVFFLLCVGGALLFTSEIVHPPLIPIPQFSHGVIKVKLAYARTIL